MTRSGMVGAAGVTACAVLLLGGCGKSGGGQSAPPPPQVTVAEVLQKNVKEWDEFTGRLQAVETVEIRPRVSGYIDKVAFTEGSQVKRGDLLVRHRSAALSGRIRSRRRRRQTLQDRARTGAHRIGPRAAPEGQRRRFRGGTGRAQEHGCTRRRQCRRRGGGSRDRLAQLEFHAGHEPDRRAGEPCRSDARQPGHGRHQRRHLAHLRGIDGSHLSVLRRR